MVGPLTPDALAALPARFAAWAASVPGARYRFRQTPRGWVPVAVADLADAVERSIVRLPDPHDAAAVEQLARELPYEHLGVTLVLTPDSAAFSFAHYFGDGPVMVAAMRSVLSGELTGEPRMTRFPLLRALVHTRQFTPRALREGRAVLRGMHRYFDNATWSKPGQLTQTVALSSMIVEAADLRAITAREREKAPSVSSLDVLSSLVLRSFADSLAPGTDMPVRMLVGLRQHLPEGLSTTGNFSTSAVLGALRATSWTPTEAREAMGTVTASPTLVAARAVELLVHTRARLRGRTADSGGPLQLTYNVLTGRVGTSRDDYVPGRPRNAILLMLNRGPLLGPHCTVWATGTDFIITTVDDSGLLDLPRFETVLRASLT